MYCGNNQNNSDLLNGTKVLGTRYQCFQKGVGLGLNMPPDPEYIGEYIPIDDFKIYCGTAEALPEGYDRLGSSSQCLAKGVGRGKSMRAAGENMGGGGENMGAAAENLGGGGEHLAGRWRRLFPGSGIFWLIYLLGCVIGAVFLFLWTPDFFKRDEIQESQGVGVVVKKKDISKLVAYLLIIYIVLYVLLKFLIRRY